jgi:hypothetical protein
MQSTSRQLYAYWDRVRNGRIAPRRFEIEPAKIASILPETFIAEAAGLRSCKFRLAGTKICEQFGRELRNTDLMNLWGAKDQDSFASLMRTIFTDAAVGQVAFDAYTESHRQAKFELVLMPLVHTSGTINRVLGAITAMEPPFWLGSVPLQRQEITAIQLRWPDGTPASTGPAKADPEPTKPADVVRLMRKRFRVYEGGLN